MNPLQQFNVDRETNMKVMCAWCGEEGKSNLLCEVRSNDDSLTSHGICEHHERVMMKAVETYREKRRRAQDSAIPTTPALVPTTTPARPLTSQIA